jgi:NTP pyrophosphatase (non-canonical NTP hydrolase)
MDLHETQAMITKFVNEHNLNTNVEMRLLDLLSEIGELAKEILKATNYGQSSGEMMADQVEHWEEEVGDAFFSLICLANMTQVDLDEALRRVLDKYEGRLQDKGDAGSGR